MARVKTKSRAKSAQRKKKPPPKRSAASGNCAGHSRDWRTECSSLAEIRAHIDRLDALIVPLVCQRHYFVTQAARFKPSVDGVVVPSRVVEIIANVRKLAAALKSNPDTIEAVYRSMIEAFTADEQRHWREINRRNKPA